MSKPVLDRFGQLLMSNVRDETIRQWRMIADNRMKGERSERIRGQLDEMTGHDRGVVMALMPEIVDSVLHNLLTMLEHEDDIRVVVELNDQTTNLKEASDGLSGELYSDEGWIARFSQASDK